MSNKHPAASWSWFHSLGQFDRVVITDDDLATAERFIREYLARELYDAEGPPDGVVAEAFTLAIVVTYARPFTSRKDRSGCPERRDMLSFLTDGLPEPGLHTWIVGDRDRRVGGARNTAFAHSDARPRGVKADGCTSIMHDVTQPLEERKAAGLLENVARMRALLKPYVDQLHSGPHAT